VRIPDGVSHISVASVPTPLIVIRTVT